MDIFLFETGNNLMAALAINVAITFNMGTDLESIVSNPIGQPLATVSVYFQSYLIDPGVIFSRYSSTASGRRDVLLCGRSSSSRST